MITDTKQRSAAKVFAAYWKGKGYEKGESQPFWISLLGQVFGVEKPEQFIIFENQVKLDHTSFIDGSIAETHVLIEQKGLDKDLRKPIKQSDGTFLTPFQQAKRYAAELPYSQRPRWIVTCNFGEFLVYDMENPSGEPEEILLENLPTEYYRLSFLVENGSAHLKREMEISIQAGDIVGVLYDGILKQYLDPTNEDSLKSLNMLCVRLVFCLYAEDAGIFGRKSMFHDYLAGFDVRNLRKALIELFQVLDTRAEDRDPYLDEALAEFPYVNGGLFSDEHIEIPQLTEEIKEILLSKASDDFDWSEISPTIFGAVFESTLNPETRRSGGMHYTSIENIHKVINPLFLNDLKDELNQIESMTVVRTKEKKLHEFQEKLSRLKFLDPACGSGNFLTETYISIRRLENEVLKGLEACKGIAGQISFGDEIMNPIQVSIQQFYGIEINDFAVTVAKTALWIAESQMMKETEDVVHMNLGFLPLKSYTNISEGNSLLIDWETVINKHELNYIMGNPPFIGARFMSKEQKEDILNIFDNSKGAGDLDYVTAWYKKAADYIENVPIKVAFVSTNSITQGEQPAIFWKTLMKSGIHIDFAYRTFKWNSEAKEKAAVHCVIVGFSRTAKYPKKYIFQNESIVHEAENINAYLVDADDIFVTSRNKPICDVPEIGIGNKPIDGGFYLFSKEEMEAFLKKEPKAETYFHPWYGAREFINRCPRYCLYLGNCSPAELRKMPECMKRVEQVRNYRLESTSPGTRKIAENPTHFHVTNIPKGDYIVIPQVSSERRRYIPMGYMSDNVLCSDKVRILPEGSLYQFGILESNVHMSWMRAICCRLKSDYSYTVNHVYNCFPWPEPTEEQRQKIEQAAQAILDARALYPDSSLADLYDEISMPSELRTAHQRNDKAVMQAYGMPIKGTTEASCVAHLMKLYQEKLG